MEQDTRLSVNDIASGRHCQIILKNAFAHEKRFVLGEYLISSLICARKILGKKTQKLIFVVSLTC